MRGGAVNLLMRGQELPFALREVEAVAVKEAIARRASGLLADGEAVLLDGGTTTLALARLLAGRRMTVMALSLHHAGVLAAGAPAVVKRPIEGTPAEMWIKLNPVHYPALAQRHIAGIRQVG